MSNPAAWTFWLKERQVTGVIVAEHGQEKLVEYAKRFYVVKGKDPLKKHYTQSTIPAFWKKVLSGQHSAEELTKEIGVTKKDVKAARATRAVVRAAAKQEAKTAAMPPAAVPPSPSEEQAPAHRPSRVPKEKKADASSPGAPPVEVKPAAKRKLAPSPPLKPENIVYFDCPECGHPQAVDASTVKVGKAFIRACVNCGKEFGVRLVPVTTYRAEVAAFN